MHKSPGCNECPKFVIASIRTACDCAGSFPGWVIRPCLCLPSCLYTLSYGSRGRMEYVNVSSVVNGDRCTAGRGASGISSRLSPGPSWVLGCWAGPQQVRIPSPLEGAPSGDRTALPGKGGVRYVSQSANVPLLIELLASQENNRGSTFISVSLQS